MVSSVHRTRTGRWLQAAGENTFSWHAPLLCVLTVLIAPAGARYTARAQPAASGERMGIAFVPHMADALPPRGRGSKEQDAERDMYELAGQMPQVSRVYTPKGKLKNKLGIHLTQPAPTDCVAA